MAHNQTMMIENEAQWKDQVNIIGASIDEEAKTAIEHVMKNGRNKLRHRQSGEEAWSTFSIKHLGRDQPTHSATDRQGRQNYLAGSPCCH
jgi:hypothetical protein